MNNNTADVKSLLPVAESIRKRFAIESDRGVGQFWMPFLLKGGLLLHADSLAEIKQDLKALQTVTIEESGKCFAVRSQCQGVCGKIFQTVGVALPPTIREL